MKKRFRGDLLQKTYDEYATLYGESKRSIKAALGQLEELGLIKKIFREIKLKNGTKIRNVMYIEIFPAKIEEISHYKIVTSTSEPTILMSEDDEIDASVTDSAERGTENYETSSENMYAPLQNNDIRPTEEGTHIIHNDAGYHTPDMRTNTEITAKNTTQITSSPVLSEKDVDNSDDDELEQVNYSKPIKIRMEQPEDRRTDRDIYIEFLRDQVQYDRIRQEDTYGDKMNIEFLRDRS